MMVSSRASSGASAAARPLLLRPRGVARPRLQGFQDERPECGVGQRGPEPETSLVEFRILDDLAAELFGGAGARRRPLGLARARQAVRLVRRGGAGVAAQLVPLLLAALEQGEQALAVEDEQVGEGDGQLAA